jgi:2-amino-4-hydroxy-6-hydroxymethyldihydropteridine diphosphokinase
MLQTVYIGLGSNLQSPIEQLNTAKGSLAELPNSHLEMFSSLYQSEPMGPQDQNRYINAVAKLSTSLTPITLLDQLQGIENQQGRVRKIEQWGPRTLDLDLLLYGDRIINSERLTVPHYGMKERAFVIVPLLEIAPELQLPNGSHIVDIMGTLSTEGITKL